MNPKEKQNLKKKQTGVNIAFTIFPPSYSSWIFEKLHLSAIVALLFKASVVDVSTTLHSC